VIWFVAWYLAMAIITWVLAHREINRNRQFAKNVRVILDIGFPYWTVIVSAMLGWPYALWRLHRGFPEDAR
jgi:hypothetical protein